uniref:Mpv17-like protein n=1 Tax=Monodon monoceros TaxID=40151 RepID=A0A8C6B2B0_MONMO
MAGCWRALLCTTRCYPWPTNLLLYATLFSAGDALQQRPRGGPADRRHTQRVASVAVAFHANFNYVWLRLMAHAHRPGQSAVRPGARRAGVRLCLLLRYEYSPAKG